MSLLTNAPTVLARYRWLIAAGFGCLGAVTGAQSTSFSVGPIPQWVRPSDWSLPTNKPSGEAAESSRYLLFERQFSPQRQETFSRVVRLMENQDGVQESGSLSFDFDPSYQTLLLHRVQIHRQGKVLDRLDATKAKVIQPEPDLDEHLFTGRSSAVLFVEDLRVGDALEYAYTVRGRNPILDGHFSARFVVQTGTPVDRERLRVVWSGGKTLSVSQYLTTVAPVKTAGPAGTEYVWDFVNLEGIPYEGDLPRGYEPYPEVEVSDFDDWGQVVKWGLPLYSLAQSNAPAEVSDLVAKWRGEARSEEEAARLALDFVQDELRYTGIEMGPDSLRPAEPFETVRLRYGDCKAKARLLCALLGEMGVDAYPALVNSSAREHVARRLPSPFAFDHAIVKIILNGRVLWVDPTDSHQGGRLNERVLPRFGKALVLAPGVAELEDIPVSAVRSVERVTSTFAMKDYDSPVALTVSTIYQGADADRLRAYFAANDLKEVGKAYINFYARTYPGVHQLNRPQVVDERVLNFIQVKEQYEISNFWKFEKSSQREEATFYPDSLQHMLPEPETRLRKMPMGIPFPSHHVHQIVVQLPDDQWSIEPSVSDIDGDAFVFHHRRTLSGKTLQLDYECETKAPAVPAEKLGDYLKKRAEMQDLLGDTLYQPDHRPGARLAQVNWLMVVLAGFTVVASLVAGIWLWRRSGMPSTVPPPWPQDPELRGLSGWLILVGLGLGLGLIVRPYQVLKSWDGFFSNLVWQATAMPGGEHYHPLFGPLVMFELIGNIVMIALNILALCLFIAQRRWFPKTYLALLFGMALFLLVDHIASNAIPFVAQKSDDAGDLFRAILQAIVWGAYILRSRRVRQTFVR